MNVTMTIAGSDSGGGAGIQADLKTFQELNTFGTSAITALTAQNTLGVTGVHAAPPEFVLAQIDAVLADFEVKAIKTGMLFSAEIIEVVAKRMADYQGVLVVDPVMIAKGGASLLQQQAVAAMRSQLLPVATVITPNIPEAEVLSGLKIETVVDMAAAAQVLLDLGVKNVVMKGGHSQEEMARDYVFLADGRRFSMATPRIDTANTHGTGCTFSAALTAFVAQGLALPEAMVEAKRFIHLGIVHDLQLGHGHGPTNHFAYQQQKGECEVDCVWA